MRDDFNFPLFTFSFLSSNIPSALAYGAYVSQVARYARACCKYQDFVDRGKLLTNKLFSQGYRKVKLVSTVTKFHGRHHDLVDHCNVAVSKLTSDLMAPAEA